MTNMGSHNEDRYFMVPFCFTPLVADFHLHPAVDGDAPSSPLGYSG
jgi:hypothetical protein